MEKYSDKVMEHFLNPRNVGEIEDADGVGVVGNPTCGDVMKLSIKVDDGHIVDAKFKTFGCGAAIATSSMVTELVKGKTIEEAMKISKSTVAEALDGLPPVKMHCSNLASDALKAAIDHYLCKQEGPLSERCRAEDTEKATEPARKTAVKKAAARKPAAKSRAAKKPAGKGAGRARAASGTRARAGGSRKRKATVPARTASRTRGGRRTSAEK
jgi:nitrogen fixation NifU-like protein